MKSTDVTFGAALIDKLLPLLIPSVTRFVKTIDVTDVGNDRLIKPLLSVMFEKFIDDIVVPVFKLEIVIPFVYIVVNELDNDIDCKVTDVIERPYNVVKEGKLNEIRLDDPEPNDVKLNVPNTVVKFGKLNVVKTESVENVIFPPTDIKDGKLKDGNAVNDVTVNVELICVKFGKLQVFNVEDVDTLKEPTIVKFGKAELSDTKELTVDIVIEPRILTNWGQLIDFKDARVFNDKPPNNVRLGKLIDVSCPHDDTVKVL